MINLSKSIKCTTMRVNPKVNCGLSVIMNYQCRLTCGKKKKKKYYSDE